ncbi:cell wall metabolism sensor histidine kinase WalK [Alicyclobacillus sp. SP_1]|uniref:sensor histidine kinase n=1 Tax=Alicyclobacillus sp. SP_1 TaxID=2942475 RepID=UPI002157BAF0|nr:HAMP domain-containing sensor histidine kinase [Alicyclobacillus sp. SP_1]
MRIRKYMIIWVLTIVVFPWVVYIFISLIGTHSWTTQGNIRQKSLTQTMETIARNEPHWTTPHWQRHIAEQLTHQGMEVEIRSPAHRVIFESVEQGSSHHWVGNPHWMSTQRMMVMENGKWVGTVQISQPIKADPIAAFGAILACILAIVFVSFQIGRNVIRPLESMNRAALQIAEGDLDFELASSNTVEIRQVRNAFHLMGSGLRNAFAKQQKLEEERRFFIGAIAHDLRTPLFSLRGYLDGMEQGIASSSEKIAHYVHVCQDKATHMERLVSDLFAFTRLEYMEQTLQRESFDVSAVVNTTVASMAHKAEEKAIDLETKLPTGDLFISGDPHLLERALTNVLDNAIRHTPNEGKIKVELLKESDRVVVTISDTGSGFSPEDLTHVFEPMYRGDKSRNLSTGGAGLGLTIARRIFRSHGGELLAENLPNGGAILIGWIPTNLNRNEH